MTDHYGLPRSNRQVVKEKDHLAKAPILDY